MNIWCEFGKDQLKIKGFRAHTRKTNFAPLWPQKSILGDENVLRLEHGPMNICCIFGKDPLRTKGFRAHPRKINLAS